MTHFDGSSAIASDAPARRRPFASISGRRLEWLLLIASEVLFLELFPSARAQILSVLQSCWRFLRSLLSMLDVRTWNLAGYIVALSIVFLVLVGLKIWKDRVEWEADLKRWSSIRKRRD